MVRVVLEALETTTKTICGSEDSEAAQSQLEKAQEKNVA
jgi:hypothetical protein